MGKINSKSKGKLGELEVSKLLQKHGFPARRGQQFQGSPDSPDVICETLDQYHIEVKRTEKFALWDAIDQATKDAGEGQTPLVFHRKNNRSWVVVLDAEEFLKLLK